MGPSCAAVDCVTFSQVFHCCFIVLNSGGYILLLEEVICCYTLNKSSFVRALLLQLEVGVIE